MKRQGILLVCVWLVSFSLQANGVYNVRDYGAKGDGKTLDHIAINKAIEAATANGGYYNYASHLYNAGQTTEIETITNNREPITDDSWYTIDGRKLTGKPTQKGIYINQRTRHSFIMK